MPSAAIAAPATSSSAPAFFVRAGQKLADRRAALALAPVGQPRTTRSTRRVALLADPARRCGLRLALVIEAERLDGLGGSRVVETRWPHREHYVPWARLARSPRDARPKALALLSRPAAAPERPDKMPVTTATAATA